jgi:hypothetical protein
MFCIVAQSASGYVSPSSLASLACSLPYDQPHTFALKDSIGSRSILAVILGSFRIFNRWRAWTRPVVVGDDLMLTFG